MKKILILLPFAFILLIPYLLRDVYASDETHAHATTEQPPIMTLIHTEHPSTIETSDAPPEPSHETMHSMGGSSKPMMFMLLIMVFLCIFILGVMITRRPSIRKPDKD